MNNFFSLLVEEKIIRKKENDCYEFLDIENSIRLIYGIFDLFWFNRPEKRFIFKTDFELDKEFFKNLMEPGVDYSKDSFCSDVFFAKKTKINNIIFCYTISSMFCYLALHFYK